MTYSATASETYSYTTADVEAVARRFTADLVMIAQSSAAITEERAREYAHDVEALAKKGFLEKVDLTLLSGGIELRATQYTVNTASGDLTMSRPGGVMWPRVANAYLRIVLFPTDDYTLTQRAAMSGKLKINWSPTSDDTSHAALKAAGGRDYASNAFGMQRKDFAT
jgi:Bacterial HORMA domain family 1